MVIGCAGNAHVRIEVVHIVVALVIFFNMKCCEGSCAIYETGFITHPVFAFSKL